MTKEEMKEAFKESIKEWMDEKLILLGVWSLKIIAGAALATLMYFILAANGWQKK